MPGTVTDTYAAAIQHDLVEVGDATLVGVVREPPRWFHGTVAENHRALGPPSDLLDRMRDRRESLQARGMCKEGAHNAAWEELEFESRYRRHLDTDSEARAALDALTGRVREGKSIALVCFEGENKACHRRPLRDRLQRRVE